MDTLEQPKLTITLKKLILLTALILIQLYLKAQTVPSSCVATSQIKASYQDDADRLALRETIKTNSSWIDSVEIDPTVSNQYMDALIAVYNATPLPERDTIVSLLNLHANDPYISFDALSIYADTSLSWMQAYKNNQLQTGDPFVDSIMTSYSLDSSYAHFSGTRSNGSIYLYFSTNQNLTLLGKVMESIPGVVEAQPSTYYGSPGKDIEGSVYANFVALTYHYAWGDCPMGCMYDRYWAFKVYPDCNVQFVQSYGDPFPSNYVTIEEYNKTSFSIWPNPFSNEINIDQPTTETYSYKLIDIIGKVHQTGSIENGQISVKDQLPNGPYYLLLTSKSGKSIQFKLIK